MNCGYFKNLLRLAWLFRRVAEGNKNQLHLTLLCFFVVVAAAAHCHFMAKSTLATHTHTHIGASGGKSGSGSGRKEAGRSQVAKRGLPPMAYWNLL